MGINNKWGNWWQSGKILFFHTRGKRRRLWWHKGVQGKVFTFSNERSANVKGHSVNVISIYLSHHPFLSLSLFSLFVSLPGDSSNRGSEREREKGVKNGDARLVFLLGPNRAGL